MNNAKHSFTPDIKTSSFKLKGIHKNMQEVDRSLKAQFPEDPFRQSSGIDRFDSKYSNNMAAGSNSIPTKAATNNANTGSGVSG